MIKISNGDLFICIGGPSEDWAKRILESFDTGRKIKVLSLIDVVPAVDEELVEGMEDDEKDDFSQHELDEHVWTSPANAVRIVNAITEALCSVDSSNAPVFRKNASVYIEKLEKLDKAFEDVTRSAVRRTIVFGDRFPFRYLADRYGLSYYAAFPGCSTETDAGAATVAFLIDKVRTERIPVVFHQEFSNGLMADAICESTGARKLMLHSCHNVSRDDLELGTSYLDLMTQNVLFLKEALL
jgi:zinc transport system substrate-binding protein